MGEVYPPTPVLLLIAVCSRHDVSFGWAEQRAAHEFGPIQHKSHAFAFTETEYYRETMGTDLKKQFLAFEQLVDPGALPRIKCLTNAWEQEYAAEHNHCEARPLNLDPGYLTLAKLVLASTKDHSHRLYMADGIYAEITLSYRRRGWQPSDWTYPDYRRADYQEFFTQCRESLR